MGLHRNGTFVILVFKRIWLVKIGNFQLNKEQLAGPVLILNRDVFSLKKDIYFDNII